MIELYPGDMVSESYHGKESARYIVLDRAIPESNASYWLVEYYCIVTYHTIDNHPLIEIGKPWIIDSVNLNSLTTGEEEIKWNIIVRSGLMWEDNEREEKKA